MMFSGMVPSPGFQSRFFVLANENRTQDAGHALLRQGRNPKVRKNSGVILISTFGKKTAFKHLTCLYEDEIDPDCLYKYLREVACSDVPEDRRNKLESMLEDSEMRRCIRIYDYLTYGKQYLNKNSASTVAANSASLSGQEEHLATQ
jgi:hypothetical protein